MRTSLSCLVVLVGCSEYNVQSGVDPNGTSCDIAVEPDHDVEIADECRAFDGGEVEDPWDLNVEWSTPDGYGSVVMPAVGELSDDNGDGAINGDDIPDIVYVGYGGFYASGTVYVHSGDGSGLLWTATGFRNDGGIVVADVDSDGLNDVVGVTYDGHVVAYNNDGTFKWSSLDAFTMLWPVTTAADLDEDGMPEVIADDAIVSGLDGHTIAYLQTDGSTWRTPIAADIDQDGRQEVILGQNVYDAQGNLQWSAAGGSGTSCFDAIYQGDGDDEAEIAFAWGNELMLYEADGTLINSVPLPGAGYGYYSSLHPGPPCVGDIDGDGQSEIVVPGGTLISAFEADGLLMWSSPMADASGAAGCSVYDMNGDRRYEVLFADEHDLRIYDGRNGNVLYTNDTHESVTYFEYPVIADVDGDDSAEIVVASSANSLGITVFGHAGSGWPDAGPTWGVHDYAFTNQDGSGALPAHPVPSWLADDVFRGRPSSDRAGLPDLVVEVTDLCTDGTVYNVAYQVSNRGDADVDAGVPLTVFADGDAFDTITLPKIRKGKALDGEIVEIPVQDVGNGSIKLRVDDDGSGAGILPECDETNNTDVADG